MSLPVETPAIEGLSEKQAAFVAYYVASGGKKKLSAVKAGYAPEHAHVEAHRLLRNDKVISAIAAASIRQMGTHIPGAVQTVGRLSTAAKSEYVRLMAASDLLNRTGLTAPKQVHHSGSFSVEIDLS